MKYKDWYIILTMFLKWAHKISKIKWKIRMIKFYKSNKWFKIKENQTINFQTLSRTIQSHIYLTKKNKKALSFQIKNHYKNPYKKMKKAQCNKAKKKEKKMNWKTWRQVTQWHLSWKNPALHKTIHKRSQ